MVPVNMERIGADFYTANCHKWLMAPPGAGFLHVAPVHKPRVKPLIISWGYEHYDPAHPDEPSPVGPETCWLRNLEFHGTLDRCPQMTIADALDFRAQLGGDDAIATRVRELSDYAREKLADQGFTCATPRNPALRGALIAFDVDSPEPTATTNQIWSSSKIEAPTTKAAGRTFLRVSVAWFTTRGEIDLLAEAAGRIFRPRQEV